MRITIICIIITSILSRLAVIIRIVVIAIVIVTEAEPNETGYITSTFSTTSIPYGYY